MRRFRTLRDGENSNESGETGEDLVNLRSLICPPDYSKTSEKKQLSVRDLFKLHNLESSITVKEQRK